ncbi:MAG TPA: FMN-binding negative transcriptional regulator [Thermomicrobiales bacterium]|nr:FMN-binding negative transcriptional regulator [Thermomicrobiales bacterium]
MYLPAHFEMTDPEAIRAMIAEHPLGTLVTLGRDGIAANHIPFLLEERGEHGTLVAHVARNNPLWTDRGPYVEALTIFQGPTAYISPNWYPTKQESHEVVPTYNYAVVHVYGELIVHDDPKWVRGAIGKLTKAMEASQSKPWKMADAPQDYLATMVANIVGIEIPISRFSAKWKASQNRTPADLAGVISGLREMSDPEDAAMAAVMDTFR